MILIASDGKRALGFELQGLQINDNIVVAQLTGSANVKMHFACHEKAETTKKLIEKTEKLKVPHFEIDCQSFELCKI